MFPHETFARQLGILTALALLCVVAACGHGGRSQGEEPNLEPEPEPAEVHVENRTWSDLTIYLLRSSSRIRLGFVTSMDTVTFTLRDEWVRGGPLRLIADPIGDLAEFASEPLSLRPGDWVEWRVENVRSQSGVGVW